MKLWRHRNPPETVREGTCEVTSEATRARIQAERDLAATQRRLIVAQAQTPAHEALAERLRELRGPNHLARDLRLAFRGRR